MKRGARLRRIQRFILFPEKDSVVRKICTIGQLTSSRKCLKRSFAVSREREEKN